MARTLVIYLCIWLIIEHCGDSASIVSTSTILSTTSDGTILKNTQVEIECTSSSSAPLRANFQRDGSLTTDQLTIACTPVQVGYLAQKQMVIPQTVTVESRVIPFVYPGDTTTPNATSSADAIVNAQLKQAGLFFPTSNTPQSTNKFKEQATNKPLITKPVRRRRPLTETDKMLITKTIANHLAKHQGLPPPITNQSPIFYKEYYRQYVLQYHEQYGRGDYDTHGLKLESNNLHGIRLQTDPPPDVWQGDPYPPVDQAPPVQTDTTGDDVYDEGDIRRREVTLGALEGIAAAAALSIAVSGPVGLLAAIPYVIDIIAALGKNTPTDMLAADLKTFITDQNNFNIGVIAYEASVNKFIDNANVRFETIKDALDKANAYFVVNQNNIASLMNATNATNQRIDNITTFLNNRINNLTSTAIQSLNFNTNITSVINTLISREDDRFKFIISSLQQANTYSNAILAQVGAVDQLINENRLASLFFHQALDALASLALPTNTYFLPYMNSIGRRGLDRSVINGYKNALNAISIGFVLVQGSYTVTSPVHPDVQQAFAYNLRLEILCDPDYIANMTTVSVTNDLLPTLIGPPGCGNGDPTVAPWNCICVFKANSTQLQYGNGNPTKIYPYDFDADNLEMWEEDDLQDRSIFPSSPFVGSPSYITSMTDLSTLLLSSAELCGDTGPNWIRNKVRVVFKDLYHYDASMDQTKYADRAQMCNSSYDYITGLNVSGNATMAFSIFRILTTQLKKLLPVAARNMSTIFYGQMGQANSRLSIGSFDGFSDSFKTIRISFVTLRGYLSSHGILPHQLMVWDMRKQYTIAGATITYNGHSSVSHSASNSSVSTNIPADGFDANVTIKTDSNFITYTASELYKERMSWVGHSLNVDGEIDTTFFATKNDLSGKPDPTRPIILCDFNFGDIGGNSENPGKLDYLAISAQGFINKHLQYYQQLGTFTTGITMNRTDYESYHNLEFDPDHAISTCATRFRVVDESTGLCGLGYSVFSNSLIDAPPNNEMCQLRDNAIIPSYINFDVSGMVTFQPRQWSSRIIVTLPSGVLTRVVESVCPSVRNVVYDPGSLVAIVEIGDPNTAIDVHYSICTTDREFCLVQASEASSTPGNNALININTQGLQLFLQIFPVTASSPDPSNQCIPGDGMPIYISNNFTTTSPNAGNIDSGIIAVVSPQLSMGALLSQLSFSYSLGLFNMYNQASSPDQIASIVTDLQQQINDFRNQVYNTSQDQDFNKLLNDTSQEVLDDLQRVAQGLIAGNSIINSFQNDIDQLQQQNIIGRKLENDTIQAYIDNNAELQVLLKFADKYGKDDFAGINLSWFFKGIENFFGDVLGFNGVGNFLSGLRDLILFIIFVVAFIYCGMPCLKNAKGLMPSITSNNSGYASAPIIQQGQDYSAPISQLQVQYANLNAKYENLLRENQTQVASIVELRQTIASMANQMNSNMEIINTQLQTKLTPAINIVSSTNHPGASLPAYLPQI